MQKLLTPKQVARSIGVSESSLKRWCDRGVIQTERTAGGHRRLRVGDVLRFLQSNEMQLVRPEVLGLPPGTGARPRVVDRVEDKLSESLLAGDHEIARRLILDLYINGSEVLAICDKVITPVLHKIGEYWDCGDAEVYQERRACEIVSRILYELQGILPQAPPQAPLALGGTPSGDYYRIPTQMVELVFLESGWRASSLGSCLPFETMAAAVQMHRPQLCWLSVSHIEDEIAFLSGFLDFREALPGDTKLVLGGQALTVQLLEQLQPTAFCDNLRTLQVVARETAQLCS